MSLYVPDAGAMDALGRELSHPASWRGVVWLQGDLGAGKTTLVRSLLRGLGYEGRVKSPTYTLLEPYELSDRMVYHLDRFRLAAAEELEWLGIRDLLTGDALLLVEWPEHGRGVLPEPDLDIVIDYEGEGRRITARARTRRGEQMLASLPSLESEITP
jgi:tRNA threonylcarbamoyladenosine biosynthesis protein TsaE